MPLRRPLPLGVTGVMLPDLDFPEQIALCRELGITHYVFRPRHIPEKARGGPWHSHGNHKFDLTPERLIAEGDRLQRELRGAGLVPFCSVPAENADAGDDVFRQHLDGCAACGATRLKVTPIHYPPGVFDYPDYLRRARERYARLCELAEPYGVKIVIEMHSNTAAASPGLARLMMDGFEPKRLGAIIDLPNFAREGFVLPGLAISAVKPWVDHVHLGGLRRTTGEYDRHGFRQSGAQMCALTESDLYIPPWIEAIAEANPEAPLIIEDYTANVPSSVKVRQSAEAITRLMRGMVEGE